MNRWRVPRTKLWDECRPQGPIGPLPWPLACFLVQIYHVRIHLQLFACFHEGQHFLSVSQTEAARTML